MEKVTGYVGHIVFRNAENGYTVFHLENDDGEVTCVGNFNYITEGELLEITGEYVTHSVYGNQLKVMIQSVKFTIWEISRIWKKRGDKAEYDLFCLSSV